MTYKPGDKVQITNGSWSNAKALPHYGKVAIVRAVDKNYVEVLVPLGNSDHSGSIVVKPLSEVEPYDVVQRLADLA